MLHSILRFRCLAILVLVLLGGCASTPPPVVSAVSANNTQQVQNYLNAGVDPNTLWFNGPLIHIAALRGNAEMVELLLASGADPFQTYSFGQISIHKARSLGALDVLLDAGVPIDYADEDGDTLLSLALYSNNWGDLNFVRGLLERGANPNQADKAGWTPLQTAARYQDAEYLEVLLESGANVDTANSFGSNPLWLALHIDNKESADLLLRYGASLEARASGDTIFDKADDSESMSAEWLRERQRFYREDYADVLEQERLAEQQTTAQAAQTAAEQRLSGIEQRDAALPNNIRRDKYLVAFSNAMKTLNYADANLYATLLERTQMPIDDSLYYFWGDALLNMNQAEPALDKLQTYLQIAGAEGAYYTQALNLMLQAESR